MKKVIARPGMCFEGMDHPGSLFVVEELKKPHPVNARGPNQIDVVLLVVVPWHRSHYPGMRIRLRTDAGDMSGLAYDLLPGS